jgi:ADP-ribose pyrophosphatase YjhB (NUDIX family)
MVNKKCDNKSVGMLIWNGDKLLLIERRKPPFGFAPPAGHVDDFSSEEVAARGEVQEEVGLRVESLNLVTKGRKDNPCRREGGDHHYWWIYEVEVSGELRRNLDETKQAGWFSAGKIKGLARKTEEYRNGRILNEEWEKNPGIEPVWYDFFVELGIVTPV